MNNSLLFAVIALTIVISVGIWGTIIMFEERETYVLVCVGEDGTELLHEFIGFDKNDINAVQTCKRLMFEPVDYYVAQVFD